MFVINNNSGRSRCRARRRRRAETLAQKAIAAGFAGEQVDGNDVIAVRDACAARRSSARRAGEGAER